MRIGVAVGDAGGQHRAVTLHDDHAVNLPVGGTALANALAQLLLGVHQAHHHTTIHACHGSACLVEGIVDMEPVDARSHLGAAQGEARASVTVEHCGGILRNLKPLGDVVRSTEHGRRLASDIARRALPEAQRPCRMAIG